MKHALSFDVEGFYDPGQTVRTTILILDELKKSRTKATFFIVGDELKYYEVLVKLLEDEGHEIGLHGYYHVPMSAMTPQSLADSLQKGLDELQRQVSSPIRGFRAPFFSLSPETDWFLDIIAQMGFVYDSSLFPHTWKKEIFDGKLDVFQLPNGLYEVPLTVLNCLGMKIPTCGGGYIRYFPYWFTKMGLLMRQRISLPAVLYMHPYEFFTSCRDISVMDYPLGYGKNSCVRSIRIHPKIIAINQGKRQFAKLRRLLHEFNFVPIHEILSSNLSE